MSSKPPTLAERITRAETILDEKVAEGFKELKAEVREGFKELKTEVQEIGKKVDADVADLARLKHRGAGLLVGVSIIFTGLGAFLQQPIKSFMSYFH